LNGTCELLPRSLIFLSILFPLQIYPLGLEEIWDYLDETEERLYNEKRQAFFWSDFFRPSDKPQSFHRETIAYRLHSFCHKYYLQILNETPSYYRNQIESLIRDFYLPQVRTLQYSKPRFQCQSTPLESRTKTLVSFQLDRKRGFYPFEWKVLKGNILKQARYATLNKDGKYDRIVFYEDFPLNCPRYSEEDTNLSGKPDRFLYYKDCNLVRVEEDYNSDGVVERICLYEKDEKPSQCSGIGEKSLQLAREFLMVNPSLSIQHYKKAVVEFETEFGENPRHVCEPFLQILKIAFDLSQFDRVSNYYSRIDANPFCKAEKLEALVYDAYTNLHKLSNYERAIKNYETANQLYREENGWDSVEINLDLSLAYLKSGNPSSCISALRRIENRKVTDPTLYLLYYYKGSCYLELKDSDSAFEYLKKAQGYAISAEEKAQVFLKLGILLYDSWDRKKESEDYLMEAIKLNPIHKKFVEEYKKYKTLVAE